MEAAEQGTSTSFELINGPISEAINKIEFNETTWSNMAKIVFRRTYLRSDKGSCETFREAVQRVIEGNIRLVDQKHLLPNEIERLAYFLGNRKAGPAGRGWWFSGAPAQERLGGAALNNPLHEDTKILTKEHGWITLKDIEGEEVTVLSNTKLYGRDNSTAANAVWAPATISHAEEHPCLELTYRDTQGHSYTVISSLNHRWFRKKNTKVEWERVCTEELREGDLLPRTRPPKYFKMSIPGAQHGLFFGDGTRSNGELRQFKLEDRELITEIFPGSNIYNIDRGEYTAVPHCPLAWGELPQGSYRKDQKYTFGFLAGYFAADGHIHHKTGTMSISSSRRDELIAVKEIFEELGVGTGEVYLDSTSSNYAQERELWRLSINKNDLNEQFFLKSCDLEVWKRTKRTKPETLKITKIRSAGINRVLCATVPEYEQFVIEGFCLTSNCWFTTSDDWNNFVMAMDLLMLGGGVGMSVEHRFTSKLPRVKKDVRILHKDTNDADFIVPDSREGWCHLIRKVLHSYFVSGRSFSYSTVCVRGYGQPISGFGGTASGPIPLIECVKKLCELLERRSGKFIRPIDASDLLCIIGAMVVAGNVRRTALIILGDPWDKSYLRAKRWDLNVPNYRAMANFSVVCDDIEDLHPSFWKTYEIGEPFGIFNRENAQIYGRIGEKKADTGVGVNPCAEAILEDGEPCNLQEIFLPNIKDEEEFIEAAVLMHRWGKRVTLESYHNPKNDSVVKRNRRIGTGITGCLQSSLFNPKTLDRAYEAIQKENKDYSKQLGIPESIRTTVVKPSGTMSIWGDCTPGIHPAFSRYGIRRMRFAANDPCLPLLKEAGHYIEPVQKFDGTLDHSTQVVSFYREFNGNTPCADQGFDTWKQLDTVMLAQKHWSDQSVSVTVYYKKEEISKIKEWLTNNLKNIKTISFLCHSDHGFIQAPEEAISKDDYEKAIKKIKPVNIAEIGGGDLDSVECAGGVCPIK